MLSIRAHKQHNVMTMNIKTMTSVVCSVLALSAVQQASAALVQNGSFENLLVPGESSIFGSLIPAQQVTGWTTTGYNAVYTPSQPANTYGATTQYGSHDLFLWGPGSPSGGSINGLTTSPDGGNYLAADGAFMTAAIQQTITGLTPGQKYNVSFYWAAAQQDGFSGATTDNWSVSLGAETYTTSTYNLPSHGFSGWMPQTFQYTATGSSEVLSFLAAGTPNGLPPFALLDGVSMTPVPEPTTTVAGASALLLLVGGGARRMFRKKSQV